MKLQLENYGYKYIAETTHDDVDLNEYLQLFKGLLITATFTEKQFNNIILELAEEIKEVEQEKSFAEWLDSLKCSEIDTNDYDMYIKHTPKELLEIFKKSNA